MSKGPRIGAVMTFEQIGEAMGLSTERVRQIYAKAIWKLRYRYHRKVKELNQLAAVLERERNR